MSAVELYFQDVLGKKGWQDSQRGDKSTNDERSFSRANPTSLSFLGRCWCFHVREEDSVCSAQLAFRRTDQRDHPFSIWGIRFNKSGGSVSVCSPQTTYRPEARAFPLEHFPTIVYSQHSTPSNPVRL